MVCTEAVGVDTIKCLSDATNYYIGLAIVALVFMILAWRLSREPAREQMVGALFGTALVSILLSIVGLLPEWMLEISIVLLIGAAGILVVRN